MLWLWQRVVFGHQRAREDNFPLPSKPKASISFLARSPTIHAEVIRRDHQIAFYGHMGKQIKIEY